MSIDKKILLFRFSLVLIVSLAAFGADPNAPPTSAQPEPNTPAQLDPNTPALLDPTGVEGVPPSVGGQDARDTDPNAPAPPRLSDPNIPVKVDPNAPAQIDPNDPVQGDPNAPAPPPQSDPNAPAQVDPNAAIHVDPNASAPPRLSDPNIPAWVDPNATVRGEPNAPAPTGVEGVPPSVRGQDARDTEPNAPPPELPLGFVRGDVVSYSYVPIRHWSPKEGIGILPYLFEYNLQAHKDGTPLEAFHDENIRRIDIASKWSTAIMLYPRQPEYRDEIINLMLRCFKNRQLIIMADYHDGLTESAYLKVRELLDKLWQDRDKTLVNPEGDMATGLQLINNVLAVKLGDEGLCGLGTKGLEKVYRDFNDRVRYWQRDGQQPFTHIRGWYNLISYTGFDYKGCYAASQQDIDEHGRHQLPANTQAVGVDVYHYWFPKYSPFDPGDLAIPRRKVLAHTTEWHRLRTQYYPKGLKVGVCSNANDPTTWLPECWNDTHALLAAIELAGAQEAMMWFIGNAGQIDATLSKDVVTYTTPVETMKVYYENLKAGPWVALAWWVFGQFKDTHGGLEYYDKTLLHYTPEHSEGVPYSDNMLEYWRTAYINVKMEMFNDVVNNQFGHLNRPKRPKPIPMPRLPKFDLGPEPNSPSQEPKPDAPAQPAAPPKPDAPAKPDSPRRPPKK